MKHQFNLEITVITGPATDNEVGRDYVKAALRLPAHNALRDAPGLVQVVLDALEARGAEPQMPAASTADHPALAC
jgi:hypothetical protein